MRENAKITTFLILMVLAWMSCSVEPPDESVSQFPVARFPGSLKAPRSVEEILPIARKLVRQTAGRTPLGWVRPGERVIIFVSQGGWLEPNLILLKAQIEAFKENEIDVLFVLPALENDRVTIGPGYDTEEFGWTEARGWLNRLSRAEETREWFRENHPELYGKMLGPESEDLVPSGERQFAEIPEEVQKEVREHPNFAIRKGSTREFLDQYDKPFQAIYSGSGGRSAQMKSLGPHADRFHGNFVYDNYKVALGEFDFPGDLWRLIEERTIEPISWLEKVHVSDPEGTDFSFEVTEQVAQLWAHGSYTPGHLYMYPHGASTMMPSMPYPAVRKWTKPLMPKNASGVVAATRNHTGVYPRMEVYFQDNRVKEVRGGGLYGDVVRAFLNYPPLSEVTYPYYDRKGYWFLYEGGLGTNPRALLLRERQSTEREHSGVIHWALGAEIRTDAPGEEGTYDKFLEQNNVPTGHSFHMHNLLSTYEVSIRGTDQWLTIIDKGRLTALDHPEVRALASRYGDPDEVLKETWIPDLPGITSPGDYQQDYAQDPWKHQLKMFEAIEDGTYPYLVE